MDIKFYEIHTVNGLTFRFKLDKNPITNEYEPHIWHRHQIEPENVILQLILMNSVMFMISMRILNKRKKMLYS